MRVGQSVLYSPPRGARHFGCELAAVVSAVNENGTLNLMIINPDGNVVQNPPTHIVFSEEGCSQDGGCCWLPKEIPPFFDVPYVKPPSVASQHFTEWQIGMACKSCGSLPDRDGKIVHDMPCETKDLRAESYFSAYERMSPKEIPSPSWPNEASQILAEATAQLPYVCKSCGSPRTTRDRCPCGGDEVLPPELEGLPPGAKLLENRPATPEEVAAAKGSASARLAAQAEANRIRDRDARLAAVRAKK